MCGPYQILHGSHDHEYMSGLYQILHGSHDHEYMSGLYQILHGSHTMNICQVYIRSYMGFKKQRGGFRREPKVPLYKEEGFEGGC